LDALTKELAGPLAAVVKGFPTCRQMHPFERALLDLTLGVESYEKRLGKLNNLRKSCLEVPPPPPGPYPTLLLSPSVGSRLRQGSMG